MNHSIVTEDVIHTVADVLTPLDLTADTPVCIEI
jgi:hypothetical protein